MANKTIIVLLLAILLVGATISGCIECHETEIYDVAPTTDSVYHAEQIPAYLKDHTLSAGFGELQITVHPDRTITTGNETGSWIPTGTGGDRWSCAVQGIDGVESLYLYTGRDAEVYTGTEVFKGLWFR